jgi:tripartite-type tricarboxylate transporter receptor subunit TctC
MKSSSQFQARRTGLAGLQITLRALAMTSIATTLGLGALAGDAAAQAYPNKPIRLIISSSAGGSPDMQARFFTQRMTEQYGYAWQIENLPGAGGNLAPERVARSAPDGYTLLMASAGPLFINASLYRKLPYDIFKDFEPITQVSNVPNILAVHTSVPLKSVKEMIDYAKANPGKLRYGSAGNGSSQHLSGELFKSMTGVDIQHVPYKSSSQMTIELVSGVVEVAFQNAPLILPYVKQGKLRALGITTKSRLASAPDIPTLDESGLPGYDFSGGSGVLAPKGTPPAILKKLEADMRAAINSPQVREQFLSNGLIPVGQSATDFANALKNENARLAPLIKATGATLD